MRKYILSGILGLIVILAPLALAARAPLETVEYQTKGKTLAVSRYDQRDSMVLPERPLSFEAEIQYQISIEDKRSVDNPAYLRITVLAPDGSSYEELSLRPGDRKSGTILLMPGHQLKVEAFAGRYTFLLIRSGASIKCELTWPEFRLTAREQTRQFGFEFAAAGWAQVDRWSWEFGDGARAQGDAVSYVYKKAGTYNLKVTGYEGSKAIQTYTKKMVVPDYVEVNPQVGPTEGAVEHRVVCWSGLVSHYGEEAECSWDFGDGSPPVTGDEAEHIYMMPGRYQLTMTAYRLGGGSPVRRSWTVTVRPISIQNRIQVTPLEGPIPLRVQCQARPSIDGSPVDLEYHWDFGDGNFADQPQTGHTYGEAGKYQLTLYLSDRNHPEVAVQPMTVTVRALPPALSIAPAANPIAGFAPLTVLFAPGVKVEGYPVDLRYRWDFGDGRYSEEAMPLHTYEAAGEYVVRLTVRDARHGTSVQGSLRVSVAANAQGLAVAALVEPQSGRAPLTVNCRAEVAPPYGNAAYLEFEWDFSDGTRAGGRIVSHTYNRRGVYRVTVVVRDPRPGRGETATASQSVTVS